MNTWLQTSPQEVSDWRELAATRAFADWIAGELANAVDRQHGLLLADEIGKARVAAGYIDALNRIADGMRVPAALPDPTVETFVDSAARPIRGRK